MLHGRRDEAADADEATVDAVDAATEDAVDEVTVDAVDVVDATWAAPAGADPVAKAARPSAAEATTHHSAFLRLGAFLRRKSLIVTSLRTG